MWIEADEDSQLSLILPEGEARSFDAVILAVPWHQACGLFPPELLEELPELSAAQNLAPGTITTVHLHFDRPITPLPHAVLVGKLAQWIFHTSAEIEASYQVVISAAHRLAAMDKDALLARVLEELAEAFPAAKSAQLLHSRVVVQPQAVFSMQPGVDRCRPSQGGLMANLFLAGDWTDTGWPATMEGAVRSGYLAVESLLKSLGRPEKILVPDLQRGFFARRIIGG
jgi:predicted NAD/FAD-dependent oxidoreductase